MLTLAGAGPKDTFLDLGCGWGQTLIIALTEFKVSKVIGVERDSERAKRCEERLRRWGRRLPVLKDRWELIKADFDDLLRDAGKFPKASLVFYGLGTDRWLAEDIGNHLRRGDRLAYYFNGLLPEIVPDSVSFPFYVSRYPFKRPRSELEWLTAVVQKRISTLKPGDEITTNELWDELGHDSDYFGNIGGARDYKSRLKRVLGE